MKIEVRCTHCGKAYQVNAALTGKKAACKACGKPFVIQIADDPPSQDIYSSLASAATAERSASSAATTTFTPPGADNPACPSCGVPMSPKTVICMSCGYNRRSGSRASTRVERASAEAAPGPRPLAGPRLNYARPGERRTSGGVRVNTPYVNGFLNFAEQAIPNVCLGVIALGLIVLFILALMGAAHQRDPGRAIGATIGGFFGLFVLGAIFCGIFFAMSAWGITIGANIMKAEVPEGPAKRIVAANVCTNVCLVPIVMVFGLAGGLLGRGGGGAGAAIGILMATLLAVPINFLFYWFLFRFKFLEALVSYLFYLLFAAIGMALGWAVVFVICWGLAMVFTGLSNPVSLPG